MSATTHPVTRHYTSENLNPQQQCSENFKSRMLSSVTMNTWWRKPRNQVITTAGTMPCHILSLFSHTTFLTASERWMSLALVFDHPSQQYTINMLPHSAQKSNNTLNSKPSVLPKYESISAKQDSHQPLLCVPFKMGNPINFTNELCWKYTIKQHMYSTTLPFPLQFSSNTRIIFTSLTQWDIQAMQKTQLKWVPSIYSHRHCAEAMSIKLNVYQTNGS